MKTTPTNDLPALRRFVRECLTDAGFSDHEANLFLAGATILGHLRQGGCAWWREHQVRLHLELLQPTDNTVEMAGMDTPPSRTGGRSYVIRSNPAIGQIRDHTTNTIAAPLQDAQSDCGTLDTPLPESP